jgi:hypothetical protein
MMLLSRSLLLHCRSFLLRSGLMLRYRVWLRYRLLRCRSLLRRCWSFLLQGRLVLRYRVLLRERSLLRFCLMLGKWLCLLHRFYRHGRTFLRIWVQLGNRPLLGSGVHLLRWPLRLSMAHLFRGCLHGWPRLRNLLCSPRSWYRPFSLTRLQWRMIEGIGRWTLLWGWGRDRLLPLHRQRVAHDDRLRLTAVDGNKLCTVGAGGHPVLLLHPQLS